MLAVHLTHNALLVDWPQRGSGWVRNVMYHYRQPNLSDGKDESTTWGADRIKRSSAAGQHRGSTSACPWGPLRPGGEPNWTENTTT